MKNTTKAHTCSSAVAEAIACTRAGSRESGGRGGTEDREEGREAWLLRGTGSSATSSAAAT